MDIDGDGAITWNEFRERLTETKKQIQRAKTMVDGSLEKHEDKKKKAKRN